MHMLRGEIFSAPCIWANSKFLEVPITLVDIILFVVNPKYACICRFY